ncbi:MAG: hypothetical protein ACKVT0_13380, partial [Planctomycetaceae bacterium]
MSDQQFTSSSLDQPLSQSNASAPQSDDEFEEITSDEVDRIVATLDELIEICHSENIKYYLEE